VGTFLGKKLRAKLGRENSEVGRGGYTYGRPWFGPSLRGIRPENLKVKKPPSGEWPGEKKRRGEKMREEKEEK